MGLLMIAAFFSCGIRLVPARLDERSSLSLSSLPRRLTGYATARNRDVAAASYR